MTVLVAQLNPDYTMVNVYLHVQKDIMPLPEHVMKFATLVTLPVRAVLVDLITTVLIVHLEDTSTMDNVLKFAHLDTMLKKITELVSLVILLVPPVITDLKTDV